MRKIIKALLCIAVSASMAWQSADAVKREQRASWMSSYVGDWPGKITESNAAAKMSALSNNLDSMQRNNITTVYFHVRSMADAFYDSKYEPWSSYISTARGVKPPFDPFAYLVENAHKKGLEVYAWLNPYRYINSVASEGWGDAGGDKNYENSHPEWLIKWKNGSRTWTILNPALPEVKQRIVDVVADIMDKYDVDGIVFDDYFYQDGLPESYDAADYQKYVDGGGTMSQGDWRRENVNDMVRMVNDYIKETKPWVRFGIGPAGVASGANLPDVAAKYGVEPCPGSDWQYEGIYSDPLAWLSEGSIDFISPQVYWPIGYSKADFSLITPWWNKVSAKFNRHCYISQSLSDLKAFSEYVNQIDITRSTDVQNAPGMVYFKWGTLFTAGAGSRGGNTLLRYLRFNVFQHPALSPAVTWIDVENPGSVSSVVRNGRTITWNGPENVKFTVYAVPKSVGVANFHKEEEYLRGVSYEKSYEIPAYEKNYPEFGIGDEDLDNYDYAVAVLDRYGNEYNAVFEGATVGTSATPVVTFPKGGELAPYGFKFQWEGNSAVYEINVATDAEMKNIVARREVTGNYCLSKELFDFEADKQYYWTVTARDNNAVESKSAIESFKVDVLRITSPADGAAELSLTPEISWTKMEGASAYKLEVAEDNLFRTIVYEVSTDETSAIIPENELIAGNTYYAKVSVVFDGETLEAATVSFTTKGLEALSAPVFVSPTAAGETLYSNSVISVAPVAGVINTRIMVCATTSFSARASYSGVFTEGVYQTPQLSEIEIRSAKLEDGKTYYIRANYSYIDIEGKTVTTDWTEPVQFVYSASAGVGEINAGSIYAISGEEPVVVAPEEGLEVKVYGVDGTLCRIVKTGIDGRASISGLEAGTYVVVVAGKSLKIIVE